MERLEKVGLSVTVQRPEAVLAEQYTVDPGWLSKHLEAARIVEAEAFRCDDKLDSQRDRYIERKRSYLEEGVHMVASHRDLVDDYRM